jgi:DNA-binding response OmpR family regulator
MRVLIVEDERKLADLLARGLREEGHAADIAGDGEQAVWMAQAARFDVIVLDVMLPGLDGFAFCRRLREESDVPILMVTARAGEEDRLEGLDLGADDYIVKPFSPRELVARVRAVLRRTPSAEPDGPPIELMGVRLDPRRREMHVGGEPVALTPREFQLLHALMRAPGRAFTRAELAERALGRDFEGLERTIDAHVKNLRRKIEDDPAQPLRIATVPGVGYRFADDA